MADIELVIKIPEEIYNSACATNNIWDMRMAGFVCSAIANGIPLPKGHGRLMILSEDAVKRDLMPLSFSCQNWISELALSDATVAIIEADKGE